MFLCFLLMSMYIEEKYFFLANIAKSLELFIKLCFFSYTGCKKMTFNF